MKTIILAVITIIILLMRLISGYGAPGPAPLPPTSTPTPTPAAPIPPPESFEPNYTNPRTGFSIWYPNDWAYEEYLEEVIFASSEEIIKGAELQTGAALMVMRSEIEGSQTVEDLVEETLSELYLQTIEITDRKPHTIGGQQGILVTLQGTPEGADVVMKGFLAAAEHEGWGYLFLAATMLDEWSNYGLVLETMLDSVCFKDTEPIYANPALGLSLRYPEGWVYEENGEQVIFGSSPEIISGAELEGGAALLVIGSPQEDLLTAEEMLQMMLSELPFEDMDISETKPRTIGDQQGAMITFEGVPEGEDVRLRGFLAAAEHAGRGYLFLGISALDKWCEYGTVLETTLDSVQFTHGE